MKRILGWLKTHVWPWSEISCLKCSLLSAHETLERYRNVDSAHHLKWMATANQYWGGARFNSMQEMFMNRLYRHGYGWRQALDELSISQSRLTGVHHVEYDKIERPR